MTKFLTRKKGSKRLGKRDPRIGKPFPIIDKRAVRQKKMKMKPDYSTLYRTKYRAIPTPAEIELAEAREYADKAVEKAKKDEELMQKAKEWFGKAKKRVKEAGEIIEESFSEDAEGPEGEAEEVREVTLKVDYIPEEIEAEE